MENFGDEDDYPYKQFMEDILDELKDHDAEKTQKQDEEKSWEDSLVAGGKLLHVKAKAINGGEPTLFEPSPATSVSSISDVEVIITLGLLEFKLVREAL